ncbi:hypothetical protein GOP47_0017616 [Adiantum capillus-veneris]|uniref:Uncharacterized protein n=1 Tax=Adiantum capillus-veneris TaxID=13818 RepID=A0A9D4Z9C3_ADICA|nr:hypothetical protein GOP47_0017616 [Adiantum capillus-veneris]
MACCSSPYCKVEEIVTNGRNAGTLPLFTGLCGAIPQALILLSCNLFFLCTWNGHFIEEITKHLYTRKVFEKTKVLRNLFDSSCIKLLYSKDNEDCEVLWRINLVFGLLMGGSLCNVQCLWIISPIKLSYA